MKNIRINGKKNEKIGTIKYANEDTNEVKKFALILLGVAIIAVFLYFVTAKYLVKDNFQSKDNTEITEEIGNNTLKGGTLFNRPYDEYYVLCYDKEDESAPYYEVLTNLYSGNVKLYIMDLSLKINEQYIGEAGNSKASKPEELSIVNPTLILIKNGSINKYYEGKDNITNILK